VGDKTLRDAIERVLSEAKKPVSIRVMANRINREVNKRGITS
jgi:hypothetical protein